MQVILRIPILQSVLPRMDWYVNLPENSLFLYALFLGFTAGLFETVGRYFTIKYILKDRLGYYSGISHGIGHGGIEMIMLVGFAYVNNIIYSIQINAGTFQQTIDAVAAAQPAAVAQFEAAQQLLISSPPSVYWLAIVERILTLTFHIAMSLLIMEGIVRKKDMKFAGIVLVLHTALDTIAVIMAVNGVNTWLIEGMVAVFAIGALIYIITSKKRFGDKIHPVEKDSEALASDY